jgi:hypothetical protein
VARVADNGTDHWKGTDTDLLLPALPVTQREERLKRGQAGRNLSVIDEGGELKISKTTAKRWDVSKMFPVIHCHQVSG